MYIYIIAFYSMYGLYMDMNHWLGEFLGILQNTPNVRFSSWKPIECKTIDVAQKYGFIMVYHPDRRP